MRDMRLPSVLPGPPRPAPPPAWCCCCWCSAGCWLGIRCVSLPTRTISGCPLPPSPGSCSGDAADAGGGGGAPKRPAGAPAPPPNCSCKPPPASAMKPPPACACAAAACCSCAMGMGMGGGECCVGPALRLGADATRGAMPPCACSIATGGAELGPAGGTAGPRRRRPDRLVPRAVQACGMPPLPSSSENRSLPSEGSSSSSSSSLLSACRQAGRQGRHKEQGARGGGGGGGGRPWSRGPHERRARALHALACTMRRRFTGSRPRRRCPLSRTPSGSTHPMVAAAPRPRAGRAPAAGGRRQLAPGALATRRKQVRHLGRHLRARSSQV